MGLLNDQACYSAPEQERVRRMDRLAEWRGKAVAGLKYVLAEFSPLIGFWVLTLTVSTRAAIAGVVVIILIDGIWRYRVGRPITKLYMITSGLTLVFGAVDLWSDSPFMLAYESVITNFLTGAFFAAGAIGRKPLVQELAEQQSGETFEDRADYRAFFRLFTWLWTSYFFLKAALYFWAAWTLPLVQAMAVRSVGGTASMAVMVLISATQGERLFRLCQRWGWIPIVEPEPEPEPAPPAP